ERRMGARADAREPARAGTSTGEDVARPGAPGCGGSGSGWRRPALPAVVHGARELDPAPARPAPGAERSGNDPLAAEAWRRSATGRIAEDPPGAQPGAERFELIAPLRRRGAARGRARHAIAPHGALGRRIDMGLDGVPQGRRT